MTSRAELHPARDFWSLNASYRRHYRIGALPVRYAFLHPISQRRQHLGYREKPASLNDPLFVHRRARRFITGREHENNLWARWLRDKKMPPP